MIRSAAAALTALMLLIPTAAAAQIVPPEPPIPCPWWQCDGPNEVVVEEYRLEATIDRSVATTRITQVLRNDGRLAAEGQFLHPIPAEAAVTGLTLWIDGEPVDGELLDGDSARRTYEDIVRKTLDPALLEFADDDLLRLEVFPIPPGGTRRVEVEYRQVLAGDGGLTRYRQPLAREHGDVAVESVVARIEILEPDGIKTIHSPTHKVSIDRIDSSTAVVGYEGSGPIDSDFALYFSTDAAPVSVDVLSYRDGEDGWFLLLASPGLAPSTDVTPKDVALVLDVSGSMEGEKLSQAKEAARLVLDDLNPDDRFDVLAFSTGVSSFGGGLQSASKARQATDWVDRLGAAGSTDIHGALSEAFSRSEPGRPLYVLFLTDGLPTEGLVDTADILEALSELETEPISVFAFGVGFDVDTVLLDSIARDHHGTTQYVVPGEAIDDAVATLSAKIASPVLTSVSLGIQGVGAFDMYPQPIPDLFSGEQLVLAGRYEGWGPASVTLSGMLRGEPVSITYDDVRFSAAGGEEAAASLWATRKIGALLRELRIDGPSDEIIDQIVRISIRHGVVTPYTSYLVTEESPFGEEAIDVIARDAAAAAAATLAASGEASVSAADAAADLAGTDVAPVVSPDQRVVVAGGRTFRLTDGVWIDTTFDPSMERVRVAFGSPDFFTLAAANPTAASALSVGPSVIFVLDGLAYEVVAADGIADELPAPLVEQSTTTSAAPSPPLMLATEPITDTPIATVALLAALGAAGVLMVLSTRRNQRRDE